MSNGPSCTDSTKSFPDYTKYVLLHGVFGFVIHKEYLEVGLPEVLNEKGVNVHVYQEWHIDHSTTPPTPATPEPTDLTLHTSRDCRNWTVASHLHPGEVRDILRAGTVPFPDLSTDEIDVHRAAFKFKLPHPTHIDLAYMADSTRTGRPFYSDRLGDHPGQQATLFILAYQMLAPEKSIFHIYSQEKDATNNPGPTHPAKIYEGHNRMWGNTLHLTFNLMKHPDNFDWLPMPDVDGLACADLHARDELSFRDGRLDRKAIPFDADTFCGPSGSGCQKDGC